MKIELQEATDPEQGWVLVSRHTSVADARRELLWHTAKEMFYTGEAPHTHRLKINNKEDTDGER